MSDSFSAFKFYSTPPNSTINSPATPRMAAISSRSHPYCICPHCTQLFTLNQHPAYVGEQGTSSSGGFHMNSQQTSRWSPTPAQLLVLEELYRQGTRTPTAEQIQQIASQLRRFGKIEGKNVFYWFQNHKARERQKRRRREMETSAAASAEEKDQYNMGSSEKHQEAGGLRRTGDEVKETKKWASTSNYCSRLAEESASLDIAESEANGWTQFKGREVQVREGKCQNIHMIPCSLPNLFINASTITTTSVATIHRTPTISQYYNLPYMFNKYDDDDDDDEINDKDRRTLELFPLRRDSEDGVRHTDEGNNSKFCNISASINSETNCNQFFEFLPLKN